MAIKKETHTEFRRRANSNLATGRRPFTSKTKRYPSTKVVHVVNPAGSGHTRRAARATKWADAPEKYKFAEPLR